MAPSRNYGDEDEEVLKDEPAYIELTRDQLRAKEQFLNDPHRRARALMEQKYHLPNNNWRQDLMQYFANNHPLFGICFHVRDHPIGWGMRTMCFLSSIIFGLCITNLFWLWARDPNNSAGSASLVTVNTKGIPGSNYTSYVANVDDENNVEVTQDMILLWTVGGLLQGFFDNMIWTLSVCSCCDPGGRFHYLAKYKRFGVGLLAFFIMIIMAITTMAVVIVGIEQADEDAEAANVQQAKTAGIFDDQIDLSASTKENYEFLMSYVVELTLALFVYFPLTGAILFWGGLGCYKYPGVGGRPYELKEEEEKLREILDDPEMVQALIKNPERALAEMDEEGDEIWGMRQKNEDGEYEDDEPPCCRWCRRGNNKESDTAENGVRGVNDYDNDRVANTQSRNVGDLKWKSYPKVTKENKKEDVGRAASASSSIARSKQESSYPKVEKKNKKEDVGRSVSSSPTRSKQESSYPKVDRKNRKEDTGRSSTSSNKKSSSRSKSPSKRRSGSPSRKSSRK